MEVQNSRRTLTTGSPIEDYKRWLEESEQRELVLRGLLDIATDRLLALGNTPGGTSSLALLGMIHRAMKEQP